MKSQETAKREQEIVFGKYARDAYKAIEKYAHVCSGNSKGGCQNLILSPTTVLIDIYYTINTAIKKSTLTLNYVGC